MSIGPEQTVEVAGSTTLQATRAIVKKGFIAYFTAPAHYLFYATLTATVVGLFVGMSFSANYYLLLAALAVVELIRVYRPAPLKDAQP